MDYMEDTIDWIRRECPGFGSSTVAWFVAYKVFHSRSIITSFFVNSKSKTTPVADSKLDLTQKDSVSKMDIAIWRCLNYSLTTLVGAIALYGQHWTTRPNLYFQDWPNQELR